MNLPTDIEILHRTELVHIHWCCGRTLCGIPLVCSGPSSVIYVGKDQLEKATCPTCMAKLKEKQK